MKGFRNGKILWLGILWTKEYSVVKPKAFLLWVDYGLKEVCAMGDGLFLFIFNDVSGPQAILYEGSWFIVKQAIILKKWNDDVDFKKEKFVTLPLWVDF